MSRLNWVALIATAFFSSLASTQEIEPRRWTPLPLGTQVVSVGYARSYGDVAFDPVLQIDNAQTEIDSAILSYVKPFKAFGRLARVDLLAPLQHATWEGDLQASPASTERRGFGDPRVRLSINFAGAPAANPKELRQYLGSNPANTQVGLAVAVTLPWGHYENDKLLNLGQNRYTYQGQLGALHNRGLWSFELTASLFVFGDNTDFYGGNTYSQESLAALQAHVIKRFQSGMWLSASMGNGLGGESSINGIAKNDNRDNRAYALSLGFPVKRYHSLKLSFLHSETHRYTGADLETIALVWSGLYH